MIPRGWWISVGVSISSVINRCLIVTGALDSIIGKINKSRNIPGVKEMTKFKRKFVKAFGLTAVAVTLAAIGLLFYAFYIEPSRLVVNKRILKISGWSKPFDGFRIVAISDIHGGAAFIDEEKLRHLVEVANSQNPDLIVLLGDFVSQKRENKPIRQRALKMPIATIANKLKPLNAKHGVIAVLGNHDGWYDDKIVSDTLQSTGIQVLQNDIHEIRRNGKVLNVLGLIDRLNIESPTVFRQELINKVKKIENEGDLVILEHSPDVIPMVTGENSISKRTKLFLAGHTHGGQVWFPVFGNLLVPSKFGDKYASGHIKDG